MSATTLTAREASIFACLTDVVVAPVPPLPAVRDTDAVVSLAAALAASPPVNRLALRAGLYALELAPRALGFKARLRRLAPADRERAVAQLGRSAALGPVLKALRSLAHLSYYGDAGVLAVLGYDPAAVVARGRALRAAEGRW